MHNFTKKLGLDVLGRGFVASQCIINFDTVHRFVIFIKCNTIMQWSSIRATLKIDKGKKERVERRSEKENDRQTGSHQSMALKLELHLTFKIGWAHS